MAVLAEVFLDGFIGLDGAGERSDGSEQQFGGSVRVGDDAPDFEAEQGNLSIEALEPDGVNGVPLVLRDAG